MIKLFLFVILACSISCSSINTKLLEPKRSEASISLHANNEQDLYKIFDQITDTKVIE